jgi:hypothetical protein
MLTCQKCGHQTAETNARFCAQCGLALARPKKKPEPGQRISAPLILITIGICLCPVLNALFIWSGFEGGCTAFLQSLLPNTASVVVLDIYGKVSTAMLLIMAVTVAYLFISRKSQAPVACLLLFTFFAVDNLIQAMWLYQDRHAYYGIVSIATAKFLFWGVLAYFWWGYISVSERVRAIFVN